MTPVAVTVHGGMLRLETPGNGHIVDITPGVASVLATSGVDRGVVSVFATGSTVAVTTMEYEPGGVHDLQALLDRLIPTGGEYEHNRRNHDTNAHAHLRAAVIGPSRVDPGGRRPAGPGHLAAGGADRLRRPAAPADGHGPGAVVALGPPLRPSHESPRRTRRPIRGRRPGAGSAAASCLRRASRPILSAILIGPLRNRDGFGRAPGRKPLPKRCDGL